MTPDEYEKLSPEEKEHFYRGAKCGQFVDKRELRDVIFHETDHRPKPHIPRIIGKQFGNVFPAARIAPESFLIAGVTGKKSGGSSQTPAAQ